LTGEIRLSEDAVDIFKKNIKRRSECCIERAIFYRHIVFPSKPVVLAEKILGVNLSPIVSEKLLLDCVMYPIEAYKRADTPFFKTDTHPSPKGSWEISKLLSKLLNVDLGKPKYKNSYLLGDLNKMLGVTELERFEQFVGVEGLHYKVWDVNNFDTVAGNNEKIRIIKNPFAKTSKRVLIFGDSFFNFNLNDQLATIFEEIIFIRTANFLYEIVDYISPDVILSGQVERYLPSPVSDERYKFPLLHTLLSSTSNKALSAEFGSALNAVFSAKESEEYQRWHNNISANLYRDVALELEIDNLSLALEFMENAFVYRPDSPLIAQKVKSYKRLLGI